MQKNVHRYAEDAFWAEINLSNNTIPEIISDVKRVDSTCVATGKIIFNYDNSKRRIQRVNLYSDLYKFTKFVTTQRNTYSTRTHHTERRNLVGNRNAAFLSSSRCRAFRIRNYWNNPTFIYEQCFHDFHSCQQFQLYQRIHHNNHYAFSLVFFFLKSKFQPAPLGVLLL